MAEKADPTTGLTPSEIELIRSTWSLVKKDIPNNGYDLFIRLFTENPTYQQYFKAFKDVPISSLKGNKKLLAHANGVLYTLTMLVDNLEDPEVVIEALDRISRNHYRRKITIEMFARLEIALVGLLKEKLGSKLMDEKTCSAWHKTYGVILSVVKKGLDDAEAEDKQNK